MTGQIPPSNGHQPSAGHVTEIIGHAPEFGGHDAETAGHAPPKYALAREFCNKRLPLAVLKSNAGFYIGKFDEEGPCSRESIEYFPSEELAKKALESGNWTQKPYP